MIGCRGDVVVECNELGTDFIDKETCEGEGISCHKEMSYGSAVLPLKIKAMSDVNTGVFFFSRAAVTEANATYALVVANRTHRCHC